MEAKESKTGIIVAVIGGITAILAACVTGIFGVLQITLDRNDPQPTQPVAAVQEEQRTITLPAPTATSTAVPTQRPTPTPAPGLLFATEITASGLAIDPGTTFSADTQEIYAVFAAGMTPPGTQVSEPEPRDGAYYAFLRIMEDSEITKIGWRWLFNGEVVNEYETEVEPGHDIWLNRFDYNEGGMFRGAPLGPGSYRVIITIGGNHSISSELIIEPEP